MDSKSCPVVSGCHLGVLALHYPLYWPVRLDQCVGYFGVLNGSACCTCTSACCTRFLDQTVRQIGLTATGEHCISPLLTVLGNLLQVCPSVGALEMVLNTSDLVFHCSQSVGQILEQCISNHWINRRNRSSKSCVVHSELWHPLEWRGGAISS